MSEPISSPAGSGAEPGGAPAGKHFMHFLRSKTHVFGSIFYSLLCNVNGKFKANLFGIYTLKENLVVDVLT